ncbi:hypothetical protein ACI2KC_12880 [Pseudomonas monteilii]|uniref:hypothetical protein n=1 Tax=Pseudomonas alabamensis TaxID=3064349 RepID=UPI0011AA9B6C
MSTPKVSYVTLNDSRLMAEARLSIAGHDIPLSDFDFAEFGKVQRKTSLSWSSVSQGQQYGPALGSRKLSACRQAIRITSSGPAELVLDTQTRIGLGDDWVKSGSYILSVEIYLEVPYKALQSVPDHIKPILHYSEVVNVRVALEPATSPVMTAVKKSPLYETYGELGFFMADLSKMNAYITSKLGKGRFNLVDVFCETEIANELFDEGLLILVWGITPWTYYVYGLDSKDDMAQVPSLEQPQFSGVYALQSGTDTLSIVPGDYLMSWPDCLDIEFPKLSLGGKGETVHVDVHVMGYGVPDFGMGPYLTVVTVYRDEIQVARQPLLMCDIERVEPPFCS